MSNNITQYHEDEIDLKQLLEILLDHKRFIVSVTGLITALAIGFTLMIQPTYKANISLLSPSASSIIELNKAGLSNETSETTYYSFLNKVLSKEFQKNIFDENDYLTKLNPNNEPIENIEDYFFKFTKTINIDRQIQKDTEQIGYEEPVNISLYGNNALVISSFLNDLVKAADSHTVNEILITNQNKIDIKLEEIEKEKILLLVKAKQDRLSQIERIKEEDRQKINEINDQIDQLRVKEKKDRLNKIQVVSDAAKIANTLGIADNNFKIIKDNQISSSALTVSIGDNQELPEWYLFGEKALLTRVEILKSRTNDDPYIPEIAGLQSTLKETQSNQKLRTLEMRKDDSPFIAEINKLDIEATQLKSLILNSKGINAMRINQRAYTPADPIKQNKKLTVIVAFIAGLILSTFLVFIMNAFRSEDNKLLV